jgi:hypothetical protein
MNITEIKDAVRSGKKVCCATTAYEVRLHHFRDGEEQWLITCTLNDHSIGLTNLKGDKLNGDEEQFFTPATP